MGGHWATANAQPKSILRPEYVHVQYLSNICPIFQFQFSKAQNMNPEFEIPRSKVCPMCVQREKLHFFNLIGQALDNLWICLSDLCPSSP